jgi:ParB family chromosome partitioning protein
MGHARALLSLEPLEQERLARLIADRQLSVRQAEAMVRELLAPKPDTGTRVQDERSADTRQLEQRLADRLGAPVSIQHKQNGAGQLVIRYSSLEELDGILAHIR